MLKSTILKKVISSVLVLASIFTMGTFYCFASDPSEFDPPEFDVPKINRKPQPHYEWRFDPTYLGDYQYDGQTWIDYEYIQFKLNYEMENDM